MSQLATCDDHRPRPPPYANITRIFDNVCYVLSTFMGHREGLHLCRGPGPQKVIRRPCWRLSTCTEKAFFNQRDFYKNFSKNHLEKKTISLTEIRLWFLCSINETPCKILEMV
ncbi:hypothetical protein TNCV_2723691 [Trichonephila clavipes]|nr:hypothetical protein TNCV_2723691 [Trichonephila clavipes]